MKPLATEKAIKKIETENTLTFLVDVRKNKKEIKQDIEEIFDIKIEKVRTQTKDNKKIAYIQLKKDFLAIDLATKLGMM